MCVFSQVWTIVVMLLSRKFNRLPHLFALNLFLAQVSLQSQLKCSHVMLGYNDI